MMAVTHFMLFRQLPGRASFSGAENHLFTLMKGQRKQGLKVELVMLIDFDGPLLAEKAKELRAQGIEVLEIKLWQPTLSKHVAHSTWSRLNEAGPKLRNRMHVFYRLYQLLRLRRSHIIHTHLNYANDRIRCIAWLAGCRQIVVSFHSSEPYFVESVWRRKLQWFDRLTARSIAISESVRNFLINAVGLKSSKVTTVYYGIDPFIGCLPKTELRKKYQIPPDRYVVGFVGRLTSQKNLPVLINALAYLPTMHGVIVGNGELDAELRQLAGQRGVQNIQFLGHVPNAAEIMPAFDLFCLPSRWEGLGLVLLEAMWAKVPIVGSHVGPIPEILGEGQYGLLFDDLDNPQSLVNELRYAHSHPAELEAMVQRAFAYVRDTFTVDAMVENTRQVYLRVLQ